MSQPADELITKLREEAARLRRSSAEIRAGLSGASVTATNGKVQICTGPDGTLRAIGFTEDFTAVSAPTLSRMVLDVRTAITRFLSGVDEAIDGRKRPIRIAVDVTGDDPDFPIPMVQAAPASASAFPSFTPDPRVYGAIANLHLTGPDALREFVNPAAMRPDFEKVAAARMNRRLERSEAIARRAADLTGSGGNEAVDIEVGDRHELVSVRFRSSMIDFDAKELAEKFVAAHADAMKELNTRIAALRSDDKE